LVHIFKHFWKDLGQCYKTPEICGPKFNNGGDIATNVKNVEEMGLSLEIDFSDRGQNFEILTQMSGMGVIVADPVHERE